jgi:putative ABC transport system permease protein
MGAMATLLGAVAAVSRVVGGTGIMNITLVGATERTREIGLRLPVGAHEREVLPQFLLQPVVLFGDFPARRAARMAPIQALRHA